MRFLKFKQWLNQMLAAVDQIDTIYFEEVSGVYLGVDSTHAYGGFLAHLTAWCEQHSIAYEGMTQSTTGRFQGSCRINKKINEPIALQNG